MSDNHTPFGCIDLQCRLQRKIDSYRYISKHKDLDKSRSVAGLGKWGEEGIQPEEVDCIQQKKGPKQHSQRIACRCRWPHSEDRGGGGGYIIYAGRPHYLRVTHICVVKWSIYVCRTHLMDWRGGKATTDGSYGYWIYVMHPSRVFREKGELSCYYAHHKAINTLKSGNCWRTRDVSVCCWRAECAAAPDPAQGLHARCCAWTAQEPTHDLIRVQYQWQWPMYGR